jgi:hypothetical protein
MPRALVAACAAVLAASLAMPALAATTVSPVFCLHVADFASKNQCTDNTPTAQGLTCENYVLEGDLNTAYLVYLVVARADTAASYGVTTIAGIECGIEYNGDGTAGVDVFDWILCADLEFTNGPPGGDEWPASYGGNRITWDPVDHCQNQPLSSNGVHAVAGTFYVFAYDADVFRVTPNRNLFGGPALSVSDCTAATSRIDTTEVMHCMAAASFGASASSNPCDFPDCVFTPVEPITWGQIKDRYRRD